MTQSKLEGDDQESIASLVHRMRADWNSRAIEDARYFIAFGQRNQNDQEFNATAAGVVARIRRDFSWLQDASVRSRRILEIGCGMGRIMRNLADDCGEIHGVDISDEMIRLGQKWLAAIPHAHLHVATDSDLRAFASDSFDVVYSYAVMQHLPDRSFFWRYLREALRVLRIGGILVTQFNGLETERLSPDTWAGITVPAGEVTAVCSAAGALVRSLEGENTQYVWITAQKTDPDPDPKPMQRLLDIDGVIGAENAQGTIVAGGPEGFLSLFVRQLPDEFCDVTQLTVQIGSLTAPIFYVGCIDHNGQRQINAWVPDDTPIGTMPIRLLWRNVVVSSPHSVRVNRPSPMSPRILVVTDGQEIGRHDVVVCGWAKIWITGLVETDLFRATVGGKPVSEMEFFSEDTRARRYQINILIPEGVAAGSVDLVVYVGGTALPAVNLTIVRD